MENRFIDELADTANVLINMLVDCDLNIVEYVTDCVRNNSYVFVNDLEKLLDEEG